MPSLFDAVRLGALELSNRIVMAPMTRSRAGAGDIPTALHVDYYRQRATAGLIITEGVQPSAVGKGYARTPGLHDPAQAAAWRHVTEAVHAAGGRIVAQLMHVGRIAAAANRAPGLDVVAPSAVQARAKVWTAGGMAPTEMPRALETDEIPHVIDEYARAAALAKEAGFDGIELHCTSGYLPAQFMASGTNHRRDRYGGSAENRVRFVVETLKALADEIGADRVGFRICPGNPFNDLHDEDPFETHAVLLDSVSAMKLAYLHLIEMVTPQVVDHRRLVKAHWQGSVILNESIDLSKAQKLVEQGSADAVAFGRSFIANPDLVRRFREGLPLSAFDPAKLYAEGPQGYTDYPPAP